MRTPPPPAASERPDPATKKGIRDYTGAAAHGRVLYVNLGFLRIGTDDKPYAAALVLATVLLLAIIALVFFGTLHGSEDWNGKAFSWLTGSFLFVAGIALGKGGSERHPGRSEDED